MLAPGARLAPGRSSGDYAEVTLEAWIFTASVKPDRREGFDVSVRNKGGENLRAAPDGQLLGRAVEGALFLRVSGRGGWSRVRRTGWVARAAFAPAPRRDSTPVVATRRDSPPAPARAPRRDSVSPAPAPPPPPPPPPPPTPAGRPAPEGAAADRRGTLRQGGMLQSAPDGGAIALMEAPAEVRVIATDRQWARVRLEGWVRAIDVLDATSARPAITAAMLRENPERYVGQAVQWRVQFLAHQQADELRPEMPLGHAYLLARGPLPETGFVYVMLSKEQAVRLQGLKPLDEIALTATVRSARTKYLATPVVELVRIEEGK